MEKLASLSQRVTVDDLVALAERASGLLTRLRSSTLRPDQRKHPPRFTGAQVQQMLGLSKATFQRRLEGGKFPAGERVNASKRLFSVKDVREMFRTDEHPLLRPEGEEAAIVTVPNFKGGVSKTTTVATLGQYLALRGHNVLMIDLDPQGTLTMLMGLLPDTDLSSDDTALPALIGDEATIDRVIRETYWPGLDLVPAAVGLSEAEFFLPAQQARDPQFRFYEMLEKALVNARKHYDVILCDTAPALSYTTLNGIMCADGLIVPLPPAAPDFASSTQFFRIFTDIAKHFAEKLGAKREFSFVNVLLTRVDSQDPTLQAMRTLIADAYGKLMMPVQVPRTVATKAAAIDFGTVYDIERYEGSAKTIARARSAYDEANALVEQSIAGVWAQRRSDREVRNGTP